MVLCVIGVKKTAAVHDDDDGDDDDDEDNGDDNDDDGDLARAIAASLQRNEK